MGFLWYHRGVPQICGDMGLARAPTNTVIRTPVLSPGAFQSLSPLSPSPLLSGLESFKSSQEAEGMGAPFLPGARLFVKLGTLDSKRGVRNLSKGSDSFHEILRGPRGPPSTPSLCP